MKYREKKRIVLEQIFSNRFLFLLLVFFLFGLVVYTYDFLPIGQNVRGGGTQETKDVYLMEWWVERIRERGPAGAYQEFVSRYAEESYDIQHNVSHYFSGIVQEEMGNGAIQFCDETLGFGMGCYHQVVSQGVLDGGVAAVEEFKILCSDRTGRSRESCFHGIGHGLAEFFGDTREGLTKALVFCRRAGEEGMHQCAGGALMQYSHILFAGGIPVRTIDPLHPYSPCTAGVPEEFLSDCYLFLPGWWLTLYQRDYKKVEDLCFGVFPDYRQFCYEGIGSEAPFANDFDPDRVLLLCTTLLREEASFSCRLGAMWAFRVFSDVPEKAALMCEGYEEEKKKLCLNS